MAVDNSEYPAVYLLVNFREAARVKRAVDVLGDVISLTSFRLDEKSVQKFAEGATMQLDPDSDIDRGKATEAFRDFALRQDSDEILALILFGPDKAQLVEIANKASSMALDDALENLSDAEGKTTRQ